MPEKVISSKTVYKGAKLTLRLDTVETKNGDAREREIVEHPGAIVVVPVDADGRIHFVRQFRMATGEWLLELPAGTLEKGESPDDCARRELIEEIGQRAGALENLGGFYAAPGYSSEYLHCYLATGLSQETAEADEDEEIEVVRLTVEEAWNLAAKGEIRDAKSLAGLLLAQSHLR